MSSSQESKAGDGAVVVQSGRDTKIGFSAEEVKSIIVELEQQIPRLAAIASGIVEARLQHFRESLLAELGNKKTSRIEAFADPDFQLLVQHAQLAYARSGDEQIENVLVDLIAQRSIEKERTRLALSINEAVERAAVLTANEFAELSLSYLLKQTQWPGANSFEVLCANLAKFAGPLLPDISREQTSYSYLVAQSCGYFDMLAALPLMQIITRTYGGLIAQGADAEAFANVLGKDFQTRYPNLVIPALHNKEALQLNALNKEGFKERATKDYGLGEHVDKLWSIHEATTMNEKQFIENARPHFKEVETLFDLWQNTPLRGLKLTLVGTAIGYANLRRVTGFNADISIWVK